MVVKFGRKLNFNYLVVIDLQIVARGQHDNLLLGEVFEEPERTIYLLDVCVSRNRIDKDISASHGAAYTRNHKQFRIIVP